MTLDLEGFSIRELKSFNLMESLQEIGAQLGQELEKALPRWVEAASERFTGLGRGMAQQIADETMDAGVKCEGLNARTHKSVCS